MSGEPSGSGGLPTIPKAIGSLAKRQSDVTRQGTQKLKFVPTLPARRKKDAQPKSEPPPHTHPAESSARWGSSRTGTDGGTGATSRVPVEMTASGPFAMGPAIAGGSSRRVPQRSSFPPIPPLASTSSSVTLGSGLSRSAAPSLKKESGEEGVSGDVMPNEEAEVYSDPDDGVEVIDMESVRYMDWMAPDSLGKERHRGRKKKTRVKDEPNSVEAADLTETGKVDASAARQNGTNTIDALDFSDSEEEERLGDMIDDFTIQSDSHEDLDNRQDRLYLFQFPTPFPTFLSPHGPPLEDIPIIPDTSEETSNKQESSSKRVSFALDLVSDGPTEAEKDKDATPPQLDGIIGQLELYRSGSVKMRLGNDILYEVTAGTQPSFLQHAVHLDIPNQRLCVLGNVTKRFVASPDVEVLLSAMDEADRVSSAVKLPEGEMLTTNPV